jgi:hypothetical protein
MMGTDVAVRPSRAECRGRRGFLLSVAGLIEHED